MQKTEIHIVRKLFGCRNAMPASFLLFFCSRGLYGDTAITRILFFVFSQRNKRNDVSFMHIAICDALHYAGVRMRL